MFGLALLLLLLLPPSILLIRHSFRSRNFSAMAQFFLLFALISLSLRFISGTQKKNNSFFSRLTKKCSMESKIMNDFSAWTFPWKSWDSCSCIVNFVCRAGIGVHCPFENVMRVSRLQSIQARKKNNVHDGLLRQITLFTACAILHAFFSPTKKRTLFFTQYQSKPKHTYCI